MFRRDVFTERPPDGDYILSPTGFTWRIGRSNGDGSLMQMTEGEREKNVALATLLMLARRYETMSASVISKRTRAGYV